jgi:hypothetical protein
VAGRHADFFIAFSVSCRQAKGPNHLPLMRDGAVRSAMAGNAVNATASAHPGKRHAQHYLFAGVFDAGLFDKFGRKQKRERMDMHSGIAA